MPPLSTEQWGRHAARAGQSQRCRQPRQPVPGRSRVTIGSGVDNDSRLLLQNGAMTDLGTLGGVSSDARDLNDDGDVVGTAQNAAGQPAPFSVRNGVMTDLNTLVPPGPAGCWNPRLQSRTAARSSATVLSTASAARSCSRHRPISWLSSAVRSASTTATCRVTASKWERPSSGRPRSSRRSTQLRTYCTASRMTHTLTGPAVFVSATPHDLDTCSVSPTVITCEFQPVPIRRQRARGDRFEPGRQELERSPTTRRSRATCLIRTTATIRSPRRQTAPWRSRRLR